MKKIALITLTVMLLGCGTKQNSKEKQAEETALEAVPMRQIVFEGNRYVVDADFGLEKTVPMMVHGNASFYMMLTHDVAEQLNNGDTIPKIDDYGYSERGRGKINVAAFSVGKNVFEGVENVLVFDWPEDVGKAAQGMLGVNWLQKEKVKINFVNEELEIGVPVNKDPDAALIEKGYNYTRFEISDSEVFMQVYFEALQREIPITIGTVASDYSLDVVTFKNDIVLNATHIRDHSPDNTTPDVYKNSDPIVYSISGVNFEIPANQAEFSDFAEYGNTTHEALPSFGIFGRDWMVRNQAVIDYANLILYFKAGEKE
ncbi:hypothetical protein SLH46_05165 [Draconibacterium sp. IB214405]|uniref:hypothetical protein n=1 Tax=Draconibacterium sp. IB214405 TaxID=3097352 RepID=UPI002A0EC196|nr:hypothetical protein [Draconibacterium sp. IB214405]MDX8338560.1 hypothetical protein [Draconibacterium sp. IB214405]